MNASYFFVVHHKHSFLKTLYNQNKAFHKIPSLIFQELNQSNQDIIKLIIIDKQILLPIYLPHCERSKKH
jgi:hypothetical protein